MKKLWIALVLVSLIILAVVVSVTADNGPHGGFTATTDSCASCHRAHSAEYGSNGLLIHNPEELCLSCHDGTGAGTNVEDGVYMQAGSDAYTGMAGSIVEGNDGRSLFGGGFVNALMATSWSGAAAANPAFNAVSRPVTSAHSIGTAGVVYGSGAINTANASMVMECTSCHDPHGTAGFVQTVNAANGTWAGSTTKTASYRLLRWQPQGSNGFTAPATAYNWNGGAFPTSGAASGWTVPDVYPTNGTEWYTIGTTGAFAVGDYNAGNGTSAYNPKNAAGAAIATNSYVPAAVNVAYFCAQCHDRYFANTRLRNNTDVSTYCGSPVNGTTVSGTVTLAHQPDADGVAPWVHPVDAARCEPVVNAAGVLTGWGDNAGTGDATYMFMHSSGDVLRASADGSYLPTNFSPTSLGRSCVACHVAHGTSATMTALASAANLTPGVANDSTLLRMDNRSVCLRCHTSTVNFTVAP